MPAMVSLATILFAAIAAPAQAQSTAPPPITNLPTIVPSAAQIGIPDALRMVDREHGRLRDIRLPPSRCNYLNDGRTCAKLWVVDDWRTGAKRRRGKARQTVQTRQTPSRAVAARNYVADQVIAELDAGLSAAQLRALTRRHRLTRLSADNIALIGASITLFRIDGRRSPPTVARALAADPLVRSAQANFRYALQDDQAAASAQQSAQYALAKLRLPQAHALSHGDNIVVAVIDSGIDVAHSELAGAVAESYDALGSKEGPHLHGTGIAGAIVAHARLTGGAPAAKLLAIRAFGVTKTSGEGSTSYLILKSLDYAATHGARIVNMSFAGPNDPVIARGIAALATKGIVMVAASGNAGPTSPPLYPAAYPGVIAVSATDAGDALFAASNRGSQVAVAAPGVDVLLPAPGGKYEMQTGTSFSAALVSGVAALMLAADPTLQPGELRAILTQTARDLGPPGRDDQFGAGEADAFAAVTAVRSRGAPASVPPPVASAAPAAPASSPSTPASDAAASAPASAASVDAPGAVVPAAIAPAGR
jgi:subtilisin family serine protease